DRGDVARHRAADLRGRQPGRAAGRGGGHAGRAARRLLRGGGVELSAGDRRDVPAAGGGAAEHHARPSGSIRRHGRVRGRQGAHLRGADRRRLRRRQRRRRPDGAGRRARAQPAAGVLAGAAAGRRGLAGRQRPGHPVAGTASRALRGGPAVAGRPAPQPGQRAGGVAVGPAGGRDVRSSARWPAGLPAAGSPDGAGGRGGRRRLLRRLEGDERRRGGGGAGRLPPPGGPDRGRARQGGRLRPAGRRHGARRPGCRADRRGRRQDGAGLPRPGSRRARRHAGGGGVRCAAAGRGRRRRGAVARLFQLRHVPRLRAPRRRVPRGGGRDRGEGRGEGESIMTRRAPARSPRVAAAGPMRVPKPVEPTAAERAVAGARELWEALRARVAAWLAPETKPGASMIRPSEVGVDRVLVGAVLMLVAFGTVMVFSSGAVFAAKKYGDSAYFLKREIVYAVLGLGAMSLAVKVDYAAYRRYAYPLLFVSIMLLGAVLKVGSRAG